MPRISSAALVAAALTVVLLPLASLGFWAQRNVVGTDSFDRLADRVLAQQAIRRELTEAVLSELDSEVPEAAGQTALLRPIVAHVVDTPQVRESLARSLIKTHTQLRNGHDPLQLDLNPVLPAVRRHVPAIVNAVIPADVRLDPVTVLRRSDAPVVWSSVEFVQNFALGTAVITFALALFAIIAGRKRGWVCVVLGGAATVIALVMIALVEPGRTLFEHEAGGTVRRDALRAGYLTVVHSFAAEMVVLAIAGAALALVGLILALRSRSTTSTAAPASGSERLAIR
jgi:hypothetical protein